MFIHGAGGSSSVWFKQIRAFKERYNVLLVDLRGHGQSKNFIPASSGSGYTFDDISQEILDVMDHHNIATAHFVGVSLGSILIRTIAELAPDRLQSMVFSGAVTRLTFRSRFFVGVGNLLKRVIPFLWLYKLFAWIIMPRENHREARQLFGTEARNLCQKEFIRWFGLTYHINPLLRLFAEKETSIPTLYVMGEQDHLFLPPVKALVASHRNSQLNILTGAGHVCNVERPEQFNELALDFISRV